VKIVCVVNGVLFSPFFSALLSPFEEGIGWMPKLWAAGVCVRKLNVLPPSFLAPSPSELCLEFVDSRFDASAGWSNDLRRAICASLRVFSARRAELSFCVSISLRRRV
jgi:hypothetical protein